MDPELLKRLDAQDAKLAAIFKSAETTRKYFKWTLIISIVLFVLPLFGLMFVIPTFLKTLPTAGLLGL